MTASTLMLTALGGTVLVFLVLFWVAWRIRNFGIVDIAWAGGFAPIACFYADCGQGDPVRRLLMALVAGVWSLRLGTYLARRVLGHHPQEDGRYVRLRQEWADALVLKMGGFFLAQAFLLVGLTAPFAISASDKNGYFGTIEIAGFAVWLVAVVGEAVADRQLAVFKRDPANQGRVCAVGLWRFSRHPNYFCEWLVWVGFALMALPSPHGWVALGCPVLMFYFLTRVTGIRYTEEHLLASKGEAFREYQRRTSAFVPWFPRPERAGV